MNGRCGVIGFIKEIYMTSNSAAPLSIVDWLKLQFKDINGIAPLGAGGQKQVFSGEHVKAGEIVIKLFQPGSDLEGIKREIDAVGKLAGHRVPPIYGNGQLASPWGPIVWLIEQRINGITLREKLQAGPLSSLDLLRLGSHLLDSLLYAESISIVHRDLKPDNIICDKTGNFWLIDFGLARHLDLVSITASARHFGKFTAGYAPPEQFRNQKKDIDSRCDLFALGVTLHEAATGSNPFLHGARDIHEVLARVETLPLPRIAVKLSSVENSTKLSDFVDSMVQKKCEHRPRSIAEARIWMNEILDSEKV
jgi:eukaryotic-like serine/threonine-protein kinase